MKDRKLPSNASVATPTDGARMVAPAATRNSAAICDLLESVAPKKGRALELASGTGQHVSAFAERLPGVEWQPTEIASDRRASIDEYALGLENVAPATELDATKPGWHANFSGQHLIVLINLLHLISWTETETLFSETSKALVPGGRFVVYGPFKRSGEFTSEGDAAFHATLSAQDPEIGYKDDADILELLKSVGLDLIQIVRMPANNLAFVAEKRAI